MNNELYNLCERIMMEKLVEVSIKKNINPPINYINMCRSYHKLGQLEFMSDLISTIKTELYITFGFDLVTEQIIIKQFLNKIL